MTVSEAVKALRERLHESQQAFATRLGISIRGLVNYEKYRAPPLVLLLKLAAVARDAGETELAYAFEWAFYDEVAKATMGHRISYLLGVDDAKGLLLMTLGPGEFEYASAFTCALQQLREHGNSRHETARNLLNGLVEAISPIRSLGPEARRTDRNKGA